MVLPTYRRRYAPSTFRKMAVYLSKMPVNGRNDDSNIVAISDQSSFKLCQYELAVHRDRQHSISRGVLVDRILDVNSTIERSMSSTVACDDGLALAAHPIYIFHYFRVHVQSLSEALWRALLCPRDRTDGGRWSGKAMASNLVLSGTFYTSSNCQTSENPENRQDQSTYIKVSRS